MGDSEDGSDFGPLAQITAEVLRRILVLHGSETDYWHFANAATQQLDRLRNTPALLNNPVEFMSTVNFLHMSALQMARRAVKDRIPQGVTAQSFLYNEREGHLRMWMSTGVQTVSSTEPWRLTMDPQRQQDDIASDGICVRAFASGTIQVSISTKRDPIVVRAGEPIAAIISTHVTPRSLAQHNDIASLNVTSRQRYFIPAELSGQQLARLNSAREFLTHVNGMYRLLEIRFR